MRALRYCRRCGTETEHIISDGEPTRMPGRLPLASDRGILTGQSVSTTTRNETDGASVSFAPRTGVVACGAFWAFRGGTMPELDVKLINEYNADLVIIPLDRSFGSKPGAEQKRIADALQLCVSNTLLPAAWVVLVWEAGDGTWSFRAPPNWDSVFRSYDIGAAVRSPNRKLTCQY